MANLQDALNAVAALKTDVDALLALPPATEDLQPLVDAISALDAEVKAKLPAPPAPAP